MVLNSLQPLPSNLCPWTTLVLGEVRLPVWNGLGGTIQTVQQFRFVEVRIGIVGVRL